MKKTRQERWDEAEVAYKELVIASEMLEEATHARTVNICARTNADHMAASQLFNAANARYWSLTQIDED